MVCLRPRNLLLLAQKISRGITNLCCQPLRWFTDNPVRYTAVPDAIPKDGIWGEAGINVYNVAMSETDDYHE